MNNIEQYSNYLINWIKEKVNAAGASGVIFGLSGGIDSALISALAKKAFPNSSLAIIMEIFDMQEDLDDALDIIKVIGIESQKINLTIPYMSLRNILPIQNKLALANIKSRLRMTTLYALAQEKNYLVLGTDNAPEYYLGYFTKYGDGAVDLLPIVHLKKREVYSMAKLFDIPQKIIEKRPSARLWDDQYDEDELGFTYNEIDDFLEEKVVSKETQDKINTLHSKSEHKRHLPSQPLNYEMFLSKNKKGEF